MLPVIIDRKVFFDTEGHGFIMFLYHIVKNIINS